MTEEEAYRSCERYTKTKDRSEEGGFLYEESLIFLIVKSEDAQYLLTVITIGIYGFWVGIKLKKWKVQHTYFV